MRKSHEQLPKSGDEALEYFTELSREAACRVFGEQMGGGPGYYDVLSNIAHGWKEWHDAGGSDELYARLGRPSPWSDEGRSLWRKERGEHE